MAVFCGEMEPLKVKQLIQGPSFRWPGRMTRVWGNLLHLSASLSFTLLRRISTY